MRSVEWDFPGEGRSEKRKSREEELRDVNSVEDKGLMGKDSFRLQLPVGLSASEAPTGTLPGGNGSPFGAWDHRASMVGTLDESLSPLLVDVAASACCRHPEIIKREL